MSPDNTRTDHDLLQSVFRQPLRNSPIPRIQCLTIHDIYSPNNIAIQSLFSDSAAIPDIGEYPSANGLPTWFVSMDHNQLQPEIHITRGTTTLTLIQTVEPEHRLHIPWSLLTVYSELNTARANGIIPFSHLRRLNLLTKLTLGGVFLPKISVLNTSSLGIGSPGLKRLKLLRDSLCVSEASERFHVEAVAKALRSFPQFDSLARHPLLTKAKRGSSEGHLRYLLTDVPPQPNSPPDNVFNPDRPVKDLQSQKVGAVPTALSTPPNFEVSAPGSLPLCRFDRASSNVSVSPAFGA
ncbi:hypothetical protein R3P38DRAFT_3177212 [Favolaschia claudopus]|uniref:Uncharacterized protein n=1 Tax=Favolaschia claudopus TaxID=2862362 RepID=A0AAW0D161_9AGAR